MRPQSSERERRRRADGGLRPLPDEAALDDAPEPQPERGGRGRFAILRRSLKKANSDRITSLAAALAYYAFLAIPSALLVAVGIFGLVASPDDVTTVIDKLGSVLPGEARNLLGDSLERMTQREATGLTVVGVGGLLALWSVGGAMHNLMWALNIAYDRQETRGFVRRRLVAFAMVFFALLGFALAFGVLVLGPHLSNWIGSALDAKTLVKTVWWVAEWPLLVAGLLVCFAGLLFLGPNLEHRRWRFLSFGSVLAIVIWLAGSALFAFYVSRFGSYNKTWGALSAVVVMLTWLWLSALALLLGAEVNAEAERSRDRPT